VAYHAKPYATPDHRPASTRIAHQPAAGGDRFPRADQGALADVLDTQKLVAYLSRGLTVQVTHRPQL
jgi:hypothetical protein